MSSELFLVKKAILSKTSSKHVLNLKRCTLNRGVIVENNFLLIFLLCSSQILCDSRVSVHRSSSCSNKQMKLSLYEINFFIETRWNFHGVFELRRTCCIAWEFKGQVMFSLIDLHERTVKQSLHVLLDIVSLTSVCPDTVAPSVHCKVFQDALRSTEPASTAVRSRPWIFARLEIFDFLHKSSKIRGWTFRYDMKQKCKHQ